MAVDPTKRQLKTQARRRLWLHVRATQPNCWLCGYPIPRDVQYGHPLYLNLDEVIPRSRGGSAEDPANVRAAHACCNGARNNRPPTPELITRCRVKVEALLGTPVIAQTDSSREW